MNNKSDSNCRLCYGDLLYKFTEKVLSKYQVRYFECQNCKSPQTENPYWLEESCDDWITKFDTVYLDRKLHWCLYFYQSYSNSIK